jgi:hypothetical protein
MNVSGREEVLLGAFRFGRRNMLGGDYLEFGVYQGHTIHLAYAFSEYMSKSVQGWLRANERAVLMRRMRFFGFDSFEGCQNPWGSMLVRSFKRVTSQHPSMKYDDC